MPTAARTSVFGTLFDTVYNRVVPASSRATLSTQLDPRLSPNILLQSSLVIITLKSVANVQLYSVVRGRKTGYSSITRKMASREKQNFCAMIKLLYGKKKIINFIFFDYVSMYACNNWNFCDLRVFILILTIITLIFMCWKRKRLLIKNRKFI